MDISLGKNGRISQAFLWQTAWRTHINSTFTGSSREYHIFFKHPGDMLDSPTSFGVRHAIMLDDAQLTVVAMVAPLIWAVTSISCRKICVVISNLFDSGPHRPVCTIDASSALSPSSQRLGQLGLRFIIPASASFPLFAAPQTSQSFIVRYRRRSQLAASLDLQGL